MKARKIIGLWLGLVLLRIVVEALLIASGIGSGGLLSLAITIVFILVGVTFTKKIQGRHPDNCSCLGCYNSRA